MKSYQTYLFDLDGTLISTIDLIYNCFKFSLKKYLNREFPRQEILLHIGLPLKDQFIYFIKNDGGNPDHYDLKKMAHDHMEYQLQIWQDHLRIYDHVLKVLSTLKQTGKRVGVVTSRLNTTARIYLEHVGISPYLDCVVTPEFTQKHKPHPEPALTALKQIGGEASSSVMVGDSLFDMQCGHTAGMDTIWMVHLDSPWIMDKEIDGRTDKNKLKNSEPGIIATHIITDLRELFSDPLLN